jgi:hypothetical protein
MKWMPSLQECNSFSSSLLLLLLRCLPRVYFYSFLLLVLSFHVLKVAAIIENWTNYLGATVIIGGIDLSQLAVKDMTTHSAASSCPARSQVTTDSASRSACRRTPVLIPIKSSLWPLQSPRLLFAQKINLLKPTGHVMHQQFNIQQLYVLPTLYLCVLYLSENKQRLVPLTA